MMTAEDYRRMADDAERRAGELDCADWRDELFEAARQWRKIAALFERRRSPPAPREDVGPPH